MCRDTCFPSASLTVQPVGYDRTFGGVGLREALLRGDDPATVLASTRRSVDAFNANVQAVLLYH